jgi:hypothetical protein
MARRPATYQDVIDAPEGVTAELVDGELVLLPQARTGQAWVKDELRGVLYGGDARRAGWWIFTEVELWLGRADPRSRVLVPDLSGWRRDAYTPDFQAVGHTVPPGWVAEVLSPSTARRDRLVKLALYAEAGIGHAWIVDPDARSIEVFELREGVYALVATAADDAEVALPPFEGPLAVGRLWVP